jgi:membrane protease YdiL (CAAX protease family)
MITLYGIAAPLAYLVFRTVKPVKIEKRTMTPSAFILFTLIAFALMIAGALVGNVINSGVELITGAEQDSAVEDMINDTPLLLITFYTVIVAPLMEELFFRKLLIDRLRPLGQWVCILVSGVFFGLFHGNIEQFSYAALLGILLGYIYFNTGNVWYCVAIHSILNFFCGVLTTIVTQLTGIDFLDSSLTEEALMELVEKYPLEYFITIAAGNIPTICAIGGVIVLCIYGKRLFKSVEPCPIPRGTRFKTVALNAGTILFVLLCLVEMVLFIFS